MEKQEEAAKTKVSSWYLEDVRGQELQSKGSFGVSPQGAWTLKLPNGDPRVSWGHIRDPLQIKVAFRPLTSLPEDTLGNQDAGTRRLWTDSPFAIPTSRKHCAQSPPLVSPRGSFVFLRVRAGPRTPWTHQPWPLGLEVRSVQKGILNSTEDGSNSCLDLPYSE